MYKCPMNCEGDKTYSDEGKCPVCGMNLEEVDEFEDSSKTKEHKHMNHKEHDKCECIDDECTCDDADSCQCAFQEINVKTSSQVNVKNANKAFICPMGCEDEKTYPAPGDCPVCGMHLIEVFSFGSELVEDDTELKAFKKMRFRFIVSAILSLPILFLAMGELIPGVKVIIEELFTRKTNLMIQLVLSIPVIVFTANFIYIKGIKSIRLMKFNMFTLITIGTGVAWLFSVVAVLFPQIFPTALLGHEGYPAVYFETTVIILTLVILGQMLELFARSKTNSAIKELLNLVPEKATVIRGEEEIDLPLSAVVVGDKVRVRPGNKVPIDGKIVDGECVIDESMISGEPIPVDKIVGDKVTGGTINLNGSIIMEAEKVGGDTVLARIIEMVNEASMSKAPIQKMADVVAGYFVPIVVLISFLTFIVWGVVFDDWEYGIVNSIAVLIIACPCALGLATPVSIMVGTGKGAKIGILIKNAKAIEQMRKVDIVLVD